jgi:MFS family permease
MSTATGDSIPSVGAMAHVEKTAERSDLGTERGGEPAIVSSISHGTTPKVTGPRQVASFASMCSLPVLALCVINLNESFAVNVIWPFLPYMMSNFGVADEDIGLYAGYFAGSFFVMQLLTAAIWGCVSDRIGRRPTLLMGLLGSMIAMACLGFSPSIGWAVVSRSLAGALNGNIGVTKCMVSELLPKNKQARAMALLSFNWGIGSVVAPMIGGFLADPVKLYGSQSELLATYPYILPCLASSLISVVGVVLGAAYLPESPVWLKEHPEPVCRCSSKSYARLSTTDDAPSQVVVVKGEVEMTSLSDSDASSDPKPPVVPVEPPATPWFRNTVLLRCISLYGTLALATILYDEMFSVIARMKIARGGFGMQQPEVGQALTIQGISLVVFQLFIFPRMVETVGQSRVFYITGTTMVLVFASLPFISYATEYGGAPALWTCITLFSTAKSVCLGSTFSLAFVYINASARGKQLGVVNGVGQSVASAVRTVGPTVGGWILTTCLKLPQRIFHVGVISFVMVFFMAITAWNGSTLPDWVTSEGDEETHPVAAATTTEPSSGATSQSVA